MCGRYASFRESQDLADDFQVVEMTEAARTTLASWNVAPTDSVRIIVDRAAAGPDTPPAQRQMHAARWGLIPSWSTCVAIGARMINARRESISQKPVFAGAAASKRCLVLADGYYEWQRVGSHSNGKPRKVPFYIHGEGSPITFAGLYSWWRNRACADDDPNRWVLSTTIVTTSARDGLEAIHDREPVMLRPDLVDSWLDPAMTDLADVEQLLAEPGPPVSWHRVAPAVGNVRNNAAQLIEPV
ncbi:MAG: SOS response-associated peptidase [Beutenbergiaceae bacterium]